MMLFYALVGIGCARVLSYVMRSFFILCQTLLSSMRPQARSQWPLSIPSLMIPLRNIFKAMLRGCLLRKSFRLPTLFSLIRAWESSWLPLSDLLLQVRRSLLCAGSHDFFLKDLWSTGIVLSLNQDLTTWSITAK